MGEREEVGERAAQPFYYGGVIEREGTRRGGRAWLGVGNLGGDFGGREEGERCHAAVWAGGTKAS